MSSGHIALLLDSSYRDHGLERDIIEEAGGKLVVGSAPVWDEEHVLGQAHLAEAEVVMVELAPVTGRVLRQARSCALVARYGVGVDNVDIPAATAAGIWVANVPDYATDTVADHAIMLLLAVARDLRGFSERIRQDGWRGADDPYMPPALHGRAFGIVGYGRIGRATGHRAQAMGLDVRAYDPFVPPERMTDDGVVFCPELPTLLKGCDFLSLHCPLTELTHHLVSAEALAMTKPGVIIVNTARGDVIDLAALHAAIAAGHVAGAGLDVFDREPLPVGHPLRTHPAVVATPHMAYLSDRSVVQLRTRVAQNAAAVLRGGPPVYPVNDPPARVGPQPRPEPAPEQSVRPPPAPR
jgi:D-3-phosphoglycerate dehydrogenase